TRARPHPATHRRRLSAWIMAIITRESYLQRGIIGKLRLPPYPSVPWSAPISGATSRKRSIAHPA
ncbi:MAG: hypothetical protein ACOC8L_14325, partial [Spirochaetota bacterium]